MKKLKKLSVKRVQEEFNRAVRKRDGRCIIYFTEEHLQCSHFFPVGGNSSLRFYPKNAHTMSAKAHTEHHYRNPVLYCRWMKEHHPEELVWMEQVRRRSIRYSQVVLNEIMDFCRSDDLEGLEEYLKRKLEA